MDVVDACAHSCTDDEEIKCCMVVDDACVNWSEKVLKKKVEKGKVLPILHSLQGHPASGRNWMKLMDDVSINTLGFTTTTHD